jgi:hypothetical protein
VSRRAQSADLTRQEEASVRVALRYLRDRCGTIALLAKALRYRRATIADVLGGAGVSASMTFRVARFAGVAVDDVVAGRFPPACPHCGQVMHEPAQ